MSGVPLAGASLLSAIAVTTVKAEAAEGVDSVELKEIEVVATSPRTSRLGADGSVTVDAVAAGRTLRSLGEADAVGYLKLLPGVTSGSDYGSGLSVQGSDYSHTLFRIDGVPLFFPYHFGGIFSVVAPAHYPVVKFEKSIHDRSMPSRLGALVDMSVRKGKYDRVCGSVNVGIISSGISVGVPVSHNLDITASARLSYINSLYGSLLRGKSSEIRYNLNDLSVTAVWTPTRNDRVTTDFFHNSDRLRIIDDSYALGTTMNWGNIAGAVTWEHKLPGGAMENSAYYSGFHNRLSLEMPQMGLCLPSEMAQVAVKGVIDLDFGRLWRVKAGYSVNVNSILPQWADFSGYNNLPKDEPSKEHGEEAAVFGELFRQFGSNIVVSAGVRLTGYHQSTYRRLLADPAVTVSLDEQCGRLTAQLSSYTQTLHQVGFSEVGLSSNFWIGSAQGLPVQRALSVAVNYNKSFFEGAYTFSADAYYKRLRGCSEYDGYLLGLLDDDYVTRDNILSGKGYNYGIDVMLTKNYGKLTGSAGYAYGIARRRFDGITGWVTASSELRHSVNIYARYMIDSRWSVSAAFAYNTGRPVTPIKAFYMIGENLFMDYGKRNSGNLPAYHRLDLSATYSFSTEKWLPLRHFVNVSLLNAYGHRNVDMITYSYDVDDNLFYRKEVTSLYRFMPSISYTIEF